MKRNVAPAIALENLHPASRQGFGRSEHVSSLSVASKGNDGRVLEEEEGVADLSRFAMFDQTLLEPQPFAIFDNTKLDNGNHR
jgi:hypothetical protein